MHYDASTFAGWPLREAIDRTCADVNGRRRDLETQLSKQPARHMMLSQLVGTEIQTNRRNVELRQASASLKRLKRDAIHSLVSFLSAAQLVAWGRRESPTAEPMAIPPSAWNELMIVSESKSTVSEVSPSKARLFDVRVYPVLQAPNAIDFVDGLSLRNVFIRFFENDPEIRLLSVAAIEEDPLTERMLEGRWYPVGQRPWRATIGRMSEDEPDEFGNDEFGTLLRESEGGPAVQALRKALRIRHANLMALLSNGKLRAVGDPVRHSDPRDMLSSMWSNEAYYVDYEKGDLQIETSGTSRNDWLQTRWRAIVLQRDSLETSDDRTPKANIGSQKPARDRVESLISDQTACEKWLEGAMLASPDIKTQPKSSFWDEAQKKWHSLSRRSFEKAWGNAVATAKAPIWSASGRLKKSPRA